MIEFIPSVAQPRAVGLLAATSRLSTAETITYLTLALGGVSLIALGAWAANRMMHRQRFESHGGLFRSLCRIHELGRGHRRLLKRAARQLRLAMPGQLFTEPDLLTLARLGPAFRAQASELARLRALLFEEPAPQKPEKAKRKTKKSDDENAPDAGAEKPEETRVESAADASVEKPQGADPQSAADADLPSPSDTVTTAENEKAVPAS